MPVLPMSHVSATPGNNYGGCIGQCGSTSAYPAQKWTLSFPKRTFGFGKLMLGFWKTAVCF
jgi:hypothetical protein